MIAGAARRWARIDARARREILLAIVLLFAYGYFRQVPAWNEFSRYDLVRAIAEERSLRIDSFHENTGDKAFFEGHWYSDKAPGTALLGVPVYALLTLTSWLTGGEAPDHAQAIQALAFVESGIATTILVLLLSRFLGPLVGERWALAVGLAYAFGSMAFPFATMFFGHALAAAALFGAFYLLHRLRSMPHPWSALAAGALAGLAVLTEYPAILAVAILAGYALWIGRGVGVRFLAGGLPIAAVLLAYNWLAFGNPLSLGYSNLLPGQFAEGMSEGILGVGWPDARTAGDLLFGPRGLVRLAPWFLAVPAGLLALRFRAIRAEVLVCAAIAGLFLLYNAGYFLPFGGWTPGPRFLMPALPFAAVLVACIPSQLRWAVVPLMLASAAVFLVATTTMPNAPERYADPFTELWLPRFTTGWLAETGAWLRWGLPGLPALAVLLLGLGFGAIGLIASFRRGDTAARVAARTPIVVAILVLAFSVPFPPQ